MTEFVQLHTGETNILNPCSGQTGREAVRGAVCLWHTLLAIAETDERVQHCASGPKLWIAHFWVN